MWSLGSNPQAPASHGLPTPSACRPPKLMKLGFRMCILSRSPFGATGCSMMGLYNAGLTWPQGEQLGAPWHGAQGWIPQSSTPLEPKKGKLVRNEEFEPKLCRMNRWISTLLSGLRISNSLPKTVKLSYGGGWKRRTMWLDWHSEKRSPWLMGTDSEREGNRSWRWGHWGEGVSEEKSLRDATHMSDKVITSIC